MGFFITKWIDKMLRNRSLNTLFLIADQLKANHFNKLFCQDLYKLIIVSMLHVTVIKISVA